MTHLFVVSNLYLFIADALNYYLTFKDGLSYKSGE